MTTVTVPPIPPIPLNASPQELREILVAMKAAIEIREGRIGAGTNSRFPTLQDLIDAAVIAAGDIT